ncbi:hypothetical protein KDD30_07260 [Photobacterium sp. GJ3]|uniref:hypothetical protein n=1 Tax=Photobacterium sp. GJ3 TaxID=2829502 RepID=UPI001B8CDDA6|nr:hypothetical protein [Photobacterium sp. GJ3]QUJ68871.1 hypothetical protein KDD30_07260 [Photobacterium sp. GJ3]
MLIRSRLFAFLTLFSPVALSNTVSPTQAQNEHGAYIGLRTGWSHYHDACESSARACDNDETIFGGYFGLF